MYYSRLKCFASLFEGESHQQNRISFSGIEFFLSGWYLDFSITILVGRFEQVHFTTSWGVLDEWQTVATDLGLRCLPMRVCPKTLEYFE